MGSGAICLSVYLSTYLSWCAYVPTYLSGGIAHDIVSHQQAEYLRHGVEVHEPVVAVQLVAAVGHVVELRLLHDPVQIGLLA